MLRSFFIWLFILSAIAGCKKNGKDPCVPESKKYQFKDHAKIDTLRHGAGVSYPLVTTITSGSKIVFSYQYSATVCPDMIDGGGFQTVVFEVDPERDAFKYTVADFKAANCYYNLGSILFDLGATVPEDGIVEGTKIDALHWHINIDLVLRNAVPLKTSGTFTAE